MIIGGYVRTKMGIIAKIDDIEDNFIWFDNTLYRTYTDSIDVLDKDVFEQYVIKSSLDIIDLIEVGDYVNGKEVLELKNFGAFNGARVFGDIYFNEDIKSIITKEQFSQMEYKL